MTVPARPHSMVTPPASSAGVIRRSGPKAPPPSTSSMTVPRDRRASIISRVSRERSGARSVDGESARADRTSSRFVRLLDPGSGTVASSGPSATGAAHGPSSVGTGAWVGRRRTG